MPLPEGEPCSCHVLACLVMSCHVISDVTSMCSSLSLFTKEVACGFLGRIFYACTNPWECVVQDSRLWLKSEWWHDCGASSPPLSFSPANYTLSYL